MVAIVAAIAMSSMLPAVAHATFPGTNGKLAFGSARSGFPADNDLYSMVGNGSAQARITSLNKDELHPSWSPDGHQIVFERNNGLRADIWIANADGSNARALTGHAANDTNPSFSSDGTKIIFASDRNSTFGMSDIFVMNLNGTNQKPITSTPTVNEIDPAWSPDGTAIAFSRDGDIYKSLPTGLNMTPVTTGAAMDLEPDWSPSSTQIVFRRYQNFSDDLWKVNANAGGLTLLTTNSSIPDESPVWSPQGDKIAFIRGAFDGAEVYTMNPDGSGETRVTNNTVMDTSPSWQVAPSTPTPPDTVISAGPPAETQSTSARFEFESDQTGVTFRCQIDGGTPVQCTSPLDYSGLPVGEHVFEVTAVATGGVPDPSPAPWLWTVSAPPSSPPSTAPTVKGPSVPSTGAQGTPAPRVAQAALEAQKVKLARLIKRGVRLSLTCPEVCTFNVRLLQSKKELGRSSGRASASAKKSVTVKLSKQAKRALRKRAPRKLTVSVLVRGTNGAQLLKQQRSIRVQ